MRCRKLPIVFHIENRHRKDSFVERQRSRFGDEHSLKKNSECADENEKNLLNEAISSVFPDTYRRPLKKYSVSFQKNEFVSKDWNTKEDPDGKRYRSQFDVHGWRLLFLLKGYQKQANGYRSDWTDEKWFGLALWGFDQVLSICGCWITDPKKRVSLIDHE